MSFNTSCAVSYAPIKKGNKVRLFFLVSDTFSIGKGYKCYAWDDFKLLGGVSIKATYDEYGEYSFDEKTVFSQYVHHIITSKYQENIPVEGVKYNEMHDHMSVNKDSLSWRKIQSMIHSGRLFLNGSGDSNLPFVSIFAVHESIYQVMINQISDQENIEKEVEEEMGSTLEINYMNAYNKYKEQYTEVLKERKLTEKEIESVIKDLAERAMVNYPLTEQNKRSYSNQAIYGIDDSLKGIRNFIYSNKKSIKSANLKSVLHNIIEVDKFVLAMQVACKMFRPAMGSGSDSGFHVNLMREMADALDSKRKKVK